VRHAFSEFEHSGNVMRVLVVGIGNTWARDDGVGPEIVRRLQANCATTAVVQRGKAVHLAFRIMPHPDVTLIEALDDYDVLVIVDAVKSGAPPDARHRKNT
jgi:hydrogenase maturation protease